MGRINYLSLSRPRAAVGGEGAKARSVGGCFPFGVRDLIGERADTAARSPAESVSADFFPVLFRAPDGRKLADAPAGNPIPNDFLQM